MPKRPKIHNPFSDKRNTYQSESRGSTKRGYDRNWRRERVTFLKRNPLCVFCLKKGKAEAATVVDHIIPHKGDVNLFWNTDNWQVLCKRCHDSDKQRLEKQLYNDHSNV